MVAVICHRTSCACAFVCKTRWDAIFVVSTLAKTSGEQRAVFFVVIPYSKHESCLVIENTEHLDRETATESMNAMNLLEKGALHAKQLLEAIFLQFTIFFLPGKKEKAS